MNRIFIFHIRSFWARWCPLYMRILIFLVNLDRLDCACIYIFVSTCVFYNYPRDAQDSRGVSVTRAREIVRRLRCNQRCSNMCSRTHLTSADMPWRVYTAGFYIFCFLSREFWLIPSTWSDNAASTRRWIWRQITIRSSDEKETVASMVGLERWYTILLKDYTHVYCLHTSIKHTHQTYRRS